MRKPANTLLSVLLTLVLLGASAARVRGQTKDGAYYFDQLKQSMLEVLTENQKLINQKPDGSPKSDTLAADAFYRETYAVFKSVMGTDFSPKTLEGQTDAAKIAPVLASLLQAGRDHCAKLQTAINGEPDGSTKPKKFIPAVFGRLAADRFARKTGVAIKQTTLGKGAYKARNPYNNPDEWETKALQAVLAPGWELNKGYGESLADGYRYLKPVYIKQPCLTCHGNPVGEDAPYGHKKEGYEVGEIRGGISVRLPSVASK